VIPGLLLIAALTSPAQADSPEEWAALYNARLMASADRDPAAAIAVYDAVLQHLADDDPLRGELLYWRGRARLEEGDRDVAIADLRQAADEPRSGPQARAYLGRILLAENTVHKLPHNETFDDDGGAWVRGWPQGRLDDLAVVSLADQQGRVLAWRRVVREAEPDSIHLALSPGAAPERLSMAIRSDRFDAWLRILAEDADGGRWTASVLQISSDGWLNLDLAIDTFVPADAPASRQRPDGTPIVRLEIRDVTAFHAQDRGENRIFIDDISIR
jgi:tetratricopeptide (TPR) repeat protein